MSPHPPLAANPRGGVEEAHGGERSGHIADGEGGSEEVFLAAKASREANAPFRDGGGGHEGNGGADEEGGEDELHHCVFGCVKMSCCGRLHYDCDVGLGFYAL